MISSLEGGNDRTPENKAMIFCKNPFVFGCWCEEPWKKDADEVTPTFRFAQIGF
jgi:hypothetical protein